MRVGRDDHDARAWARVHPVEQEIRQQERRQVIDAQVPLESLMREASRERRRTGVVDENIERVVIGRELGRETANLTQRREVCDET